MEKYRIPVIVICGSTATGKTALALELCQKFNGEIISADSRQVYAGMDIATGKEIFDSRFSVKKQNGRWIINSIPVYLYDVVKPDEEFSVAQFKDLALEKIYEIQKKRNIPFIVGGTGFYLNALFKNIDTLGIKPDKVLRKKLEQLYQKKGIEALYAEFTAGNPKPTLTIDPKNPRRIIRAIEISRSKQHIQNNPKFELQPLWIGLKLERGELYRKTDMRIDKMIAHGLLQEIESLTEKGYDWSLPAMSGIGYRQFKPFFDKEAELQDCIQRLKWDTHAYIRRQETWFRREKDIHWLESGADISAAEKIIGSFIKNKSWKQN